MGRFDRENRAKVFADTRRLYQENERLKAAVAASAAAQRLVLEGDRLASHAGEKRFDAPAKVLVSPKRSFEAASGYPGEKVCVLNFASASQPGGGVVTGAGAQEECLCRCSTLYPCITVQDMWTRFYTPHRRAHDPLHNDDCIYTPGVTVFKTDTALPELMPEKDWYTVDVISCAAPNLREKPSNSYNPADGDRAAALSDADLCALHEKRMRRILDVAADQGAEVMILGAFGCGAFMNPPEIAAEGIRRAVQDYLYCFKTIEFAVFSGPVPSENYMAFKRCFE